MPARLKRWAAAPRHPRCSPRRLTARPPPLHQPAPVRRAGL